MAGPNRGRTNLPPRHDEGSAFVTGGGEHAAQLFELHYSFHGTPPA